MSVRSRLAAFLIMAILLCFGTAYYLIFTTAGSVWLIKRELVREVKSSGITMGSSSGSLWKSVLMEDFKLNNLMVHGANTQVSLKKATIKLVWMRGAPNFQIAAEALKLESDQFIEEASAGTLKLEGDNLTLKNVIIRNASKIPGENKIEIGQLSVKYPIEENSALRAEWISLNFQDTTVLIELVSGKQENLTFENIQVSNHSFLKKQISAQIQKLDIAEPFTPKNITSIQNGRVVLPGSDPILIYGTQLDGQLDVHVFAKHIELTDLLAAFKARGVSLDVEDLEISINGSLDQIKIGGGLTVNRGSYRRFILKDILIPKLDLTLSQNKRVYELVGLVDIQSGNVIHRTTQLQFKPGRIIFKGDPESPLFNLDASTKIADADIDLKLRGTPHKP